MPGMYFKGNIAHEESLRRLELIVNPGPDGAGGQDLTNASGGDPRWETRRGTSFPASPYTNQMFFRTDRGLEYYYDGTRWLTTTRFIMDGMLKPQNPAPTTNSLTVALPNWMLIGHPDNSSDIYIESFYTNFFVLTTNNGTNYWGVSITTRNQSAATVNTYTGNTSAGAISTLITITVAVNAVVTHANCYDVNVDITKTGAPGTLFFDPIYMSCRLVG